jgi:uncharacterized membrane protein YgdD (TMEM256/DUF423 family)
LLTGCLCIILSIVLGAFGAHALKDSLNQEQLTSFETGVRYQMYHGIAFLILPFIFSKINVVGKAPFWFMLMGVILFSGSIYGLTFCNLQHAVGLKKVFGPITPIGGLLMIIGWSISFVLILKWKNGKA